MPIKNSQEDELKRKLRSVYAKRDRRYDAIALMRDEVNQLTVEAHMLEQRLADYKGRK